MQSVDLEQANLDAYHDKLFMGLETSKIAVSSHTSCLG